MDDETCIECGTGARDCHDGLCRDCHDGVCQDPECDPLAADCALDAAVAR